MDLEQTGVRENIVMHPQFVRRPRLHSTVPACYLYLTHVVGVPWAEEVGELVVAEIRDPSGFQLVFDALINGSTIHEDLKNYLLVSVCVKQKDQWLEVEDSIVLCIYIFIKDKTIDTFWGVLMYALWVAVC